MVVDIASSLIRNLASYGVEFDAGFLNTLIAAYVRTLGLIELLFSYAISRRVFRERLRRLRRVS
jgi:hypothetical protein